MLDKGEKYFDKLLQVDCRKEEGKKRLEEYLLSIPQIEKAFEKEFRMYEIYDIPIEILERYLHQVSIRKGYQTINIQPFYGKRNDEFVFYTCSAKRISDNVWIGDAYGVTLYEVVAKLIILINRDMKYPRSKVGFKYE